MSACKGWWETDEKEGVPCGRVVIESEGALDGEVGSGCEDVHILYDEEEIEKGISALYGVVERVSLCVVFWSAGSCHRSPSLFSYVGYPGKNLVVAGIVVLLDFLIGTFGRLLDCFFFDHLHLDSPAHPSLCFPLRTSSCHWED